MTEQTDNTAGSGAWLDTVWLAAAVALLLGGMVGYYWLHAQPMPLRVATVVGGLALGAGAFALSAQGRALLQFALASRVELRKMVWPTVPETRTTTLVVFVFVVLLGLFFWVIDWLLAFATRHLLGTGT